MNRELTVSKSVQINANPSAVWDALTNPEKIKRYLFGTETITDWQVGNPITFQGVYDGYTYKDKGNVLEYQEGKLLKYNYWSQFGGLEDKLENYSHVSLILDQQASEGIKLTWLQEGFANEKGQQHTENGLDSILEQIKQIAEESE